MRRLSVFLAVLLLAGCSSRRADRKLSRMEGRYHVGDLPGGWEKMSPGGADRAWYNQRLASTIYTDSNCARRFRDSPLDDLTTHIIAGIASGPPLREETLTLDNRTALLRVYSARMDGVRLQMGVVVLNKNGCTYDMLYLAPARSFETGWGDFVAVVSGFAVSG